jgi:hypothetical protein
MHEQDRATGAGSKQESTASGRDGRARDRAPCPRWYRPLGPVWIGLRADLRLRWRTMLSLMLLLG